MCGGVDVTRVPWVLLLHLTTILQAGSLLKAGCACFCGEHATVRGGQPDYHRMAPNATQGYGFHTFRVSEVKHATLSHIFQACLF
jgi:hypothetical protein